MTTLADLFGDTRADEPRVPSDPRETSARLYALVGGPRREATSVSLRHDAARLADFFDKGRVDEPRVVDESLETVHRWEALVGEPHRADESERAADGPLETTSQWDALLGEPRRISDSTLTDDDTTRLVALVEAAVRLPGAAAPVARVEATSSTRGHQRPDWMNVVTVIVAILAVVAVGVVGAIAIASASPAAGAARALVADEASLANDRQALSGALARAHQSLEGSRQQATALGTALVAVAGVSDEAARVAAEQARVEYIAAIDTVRLPEMPADYQRGAVDLDSLPEVGAAIDSVRSQRDRLRDVTSDLRTVREQLAGLFDALVAKTSVFGATIAASAAQQNAANPNATDYFREAVVATAAVVVAEQQEGGLGAGALASYAAAVYSLRADEDRVLADLRAEAETRAETEAQAQAEAEAQARAEAEEAARRAAEEETRIPEPTAPPSEPELPTVSEPSVEPTPPAGPGVGATPAP